MLTVSTPAETTALTTLAAVKTELKITGIAEDAYLESIIPRVSAAICSYLNVATAGDGTRTLGRETLEQKFRQKNEYTFGDGIRTREVTELLLSRFPVVSITAVVENGVTLDSSLYEVEGSTGEVIRLDSRGFQRHWCFDTCVITYVAGWLLPEDENRTLPFDIEEAAIALIKMARSSRTRDPTLKSESIPGVLENAEYWVGSIGDGPMPPDITAKLDGYRNIAI